MKNLLLCCFGTVTLAMAATPAASGTTSPGKLYHQALQLSAGYLFGGKAS